MRRRRNAVVGFVNLSRAEANVPKDNVPKGQCYNMIRKHFAAITRKNNVPKYNVLKVQCYENYSNLTQHGLT